MQFDINTNIVPLKVGDHKRENWPSPIADKFNDGFDLLKSLEINGYYKCFYDGKEQKFISLDDDCKELSLRQIVDITDMLNNL